MYLLNLFLYLNILTIGYTINENRHEGLDENNCIVTKGYSWCESLNSCIRMWETPCMDYFIDCEDCIMRKTMENIACPSECFQDNNSLDPHQSSPCAPCPPPPPCPQPGPDCTYIPPEEDDCGCIYDCGEINCGETILPDPLNDCPIHQSDCINEFVCPKITEITHCTEGGIDGYTTYQLSVMIQPYHQIKNIYALFGEGENSPMYFPPSYQINGPFNSNLGGISQGLINMYPDLEYDSWITIGIKDGDKDNKLSTIGIDFNEWTNTHGIITTNGAVFAMDPEDILSKNEYTIAQVTVPSNIISIFSVNIQGRTIDGGSWKEYNINFELNPLQVLIDSIPQGCLIWYDGCNLCNVNEGRIILCTRNICTTKDNSECRVYEDDDSNGYGQGH